MDIDWIKLYSKKGYGLMGVNEHGRLFNCKLRQKQKQWDSAFIAIQYFSHSRASNNEHNSYPKMNVKWPPSLYLSGM